MIQLSDGGYYTSWAEGEEPAPGSRYTYIQGDATIRSSHINIYCDDGDAVTNLGTRNTIKCDEARVYSFATSYLWVDSNFNKNTIKSFAEHETIRSQGQYNSNYIAAYGEHDSILLLCDNNTVNVLGEHSTITAYGVNNNLIYTCGGDAITIGSQKNFFGTYGSSNTTILGDFATAEFDENSRGTIIIHEAQDKGKLIRGFNETSTLQIANSTYTTYQDADDVWVSVGDNTITLVGAASLSSLNIEQTDVVPSLLFRETLSCDVERTILAPSIICDVERHIGARLDFTPTTETESSTGQDETTSGTQSIRIRIAEQQLFDQITFSGVVPFEMRQTIDGKYFDYEYRAQIESITKSGILYTYNCCSDVDKYLYELLYYGAEEKTTDWYDSTGETLPADTEEDIYLPASIHFGKMAEVLGLEPHFQAMHFLSTVDSKARGVTCLDYIRSVFGWSSRVPTLLINVFIRDNKIYAIQRGHEQNVVDISDAKISQPVYSQELVRTRWGETPYNNTEVRSVPLSSTRYIYEGADKAKIKPLASDTREDVDGTTTINYSYDSDGMLIKTEERSPRTVTITEHKYITGTTGNKILSEERTTVYDLSGNQIDYRSVKHSHTNYGQAAVTAGNSDSENIVSMAKNVPFDERPTPYALGQHLKAIITEKTGSKQQYRTISGILPYDSSFPVLDGEGLQEIANAILDLDRSIKETVTLSLFGYPHIIDFNDRIVLNGEEYFLSSNEISTTPRIQQQQNLSLVRFIT